MTFNQCASNEKELLASVVQWASHRNWRELDQNTLAGIAQQEGIDFATALLYSRLLHSSEHGPTIRRLERCDTDGIPKHDVAEFRIGIVPGGLHQESRDSRECLNCVYGELQRHGFAAEIIPTASFGPLHDNAGVIVEWLSAVSEPTIVVSLSKGGAETKLALKQNPTAFRNVRVWIDASGLLEGSEWVTWLLDRTISNLGARFWSWFHWRRGYRFSTLQELRRGPGTMLNFDVIIPGHMTAFRIVGFPLTNDLTYRYSKRSHMRLTPRGPSDGIGIMLGDLTRWPGAIYPVWRADHFLRPTGQTICDFVGKVVHHVMSNELKQSSAESQVESVPRA
ncbi:MAG: hypothetical protein KDB27_18560 [Planctomycetales bacterium]|nr:hypothetical protein [Planctomycetales bacterium]